MKVINTTTAVMQLAVRQNASNGQVTPLLFSFNAADGGSYGLSLQAQAQLANAKNGYANFNDGIAREQNVAYNANQVMGNDNAASIAAYLAKNGGNGGQQAGDTRFADYAANAFTRDRLARQESLIPNAVDRMLADKQIRLNNDSNPVRISTWDVQADRAATAELNRTRARLGFILDAPIAIPATAVVFTAYGLPTAGEMATGALVNGTDRKSVV